MKGKNYLRLVLIITVTTISSITLNQLGVDKENTLMVFMVGVLLVTALTRGYRFGIIASFTSVMIFNYFFTEPLHTFAIHNTNDISLIFFFLIASVISSSLTARFQRQLLISQKNEQTAKLLYEVAQRLLNVTGEGNIVQQGIRCIKEYIGYDSIVELNQNKQTYLSDNFVPGDSDKSIELPIMGLVKRLGTLKVYDKNANLNIEQEWLVNTVAAQMGIALDREYVYNERENIRIAMEREHLKSNLLRSISHDLRTPLTGIAGASSYIVQRGKSLDRESIERLAGDISEQAVWLTTLVENMLNMTRIDNGKLEVNKQIEVVDDVVNEAVNRVIGLSKRPFKVTVPKELIAIPMDGKMIAQVLINLLDNAVTHTPKNSPIELTVNKTDGYVEFSVADGGKGIDTQIKDNIFNAYVTSGKTSADGKKGIGLGLAICKAIVQSHGGSISTGKSHLGGALFIFKLPYIEQSNNETN
jgi:two-component system sensor histidine kinase KdpD